MKSMSIQKQQGFSLVELLLVLGVIALIAIAAFIIYPSVQAGAQANTEASNATAIVAGVKNLFGAKGNYQGLTDAVACQAQVYPSTMVGGATTASTCALSANAPKSAWGEAVTLAVGAAPYNQFAIHYSKIPSATCTKLLSNIAANFDSVGTTAIGSFDIKKSGQAPDPVAIATKCAAANPVTDLYFTSK